MRKFVLPVFLAFFVLASSSALALAEPNPPVKTINYGDFTLSSSSQASLFRDYWNLKCGDLVLTYNLDLTGAHSPGDGSSSLVTDVGLASGGAFKAGMSSTYPFTATNPTLLNINDKHVLVANPDRWDELSYDVITDTQTVVSPPIGTYLNYGLWYDRDDIAPDQKNLWGFVPGGNYQTMGKYAVSVTFHALNGSGPVVTMMAKVNGIQQGIYTGIWNNGQPTYYPAGKSFTGVNAPLFRVWIDAHVGGASQNLDTYGSAKITGLTAEGCLAGSVYLPIVMQTAK